jgi:predicted nucleic acid-binding protein
MVACVQGHPQALLFFISQNRGGGAQLSRLSAIEMLSDCRSDAERALALRFITGSVIHELTVSIVRRAFDLLTAIALPTPLTASDAIIATTAIEHSLPLYTLDPARFANLPGVGTIQLY